MLTRTISLGHTSRERQPAQAMLSTHGDGIMHDAVDALWLQPPRKQVKSGRAWVPPVHLLVAAALLLLSCLHYLAKPTGKCCCRGVPYAAGQSSAHRVT
jgi:hypothetical protein